MAGITLRVLTVARRVSQATPSPSKYPPDESNVSSAVKC